MAYLSPFMDVDEPPSEVVGVTVTDEGQVFQKHTHIRHSWGCRGTQYLTIVLVVALN